MSESTKTVVGTRVPFGILQVTAFTIACSLITLSVFGYYMKEIWKKDWEKYRCNILALPFANYVNPKESVAQNFNYCLQKKTHPMVSEYAKKKLNSSAAKTVREAQRTIEQTIKTQKESENIKEDIGGVFGAINILYERLVNIMVYTSHSIQNVFFKINAVVWSIYYYLIAQINTIAITIARFQRMLSVINLLAILITIKFIFISPIAIIMFALIAMVNLIQKSAEKKAYCCFTPDTLIDKPNGNKTKIKDISLGDKIAGGGTVTGFISLLTPDAEVVQLGRNTYVTGDHLLISNNKWQHVADLNLGKNTQIKTTDTLMCLVTSNNIIKSGNITFKDYEEVKEQEVQCKIASIILQSLGSNNIGNILPKYELGERNNCLPGKTRVRMMNGTYQRIDSLQVGSNTSCGKVLGIYKCLAKNIEWFNVNGNIISPRIICKPKPSTITIEKLQKKQAVIPKNIQEWNKAYNVGKYSPISKSDYGYHLILDSRQFELENELFIRDFIETDDDLIQDFITNIVLEDLNKFDDILNNLKIDIKKIPAQYRYKGRSPSF
tara:strand:+ start:9379 stop:11031 length:1653 start_codon:yes stop_codon:yes gene_type:complete